MRSEIHESCWRKTVGDETKNFYVVKCVWSDGLILIGDLWRSVCVLCLDMEKMTCCSFVVDVQKNVGGVHVDMTRKHPWGRCEMK